VIPGKQYRPEDFLRLAWRRRWLIALPFVLVAGATFGVAKRIPNMYRADTTILVVPQRVPDSYVHSTITASIVDRLQSISQQILSRPKLEGIVQEFNLYPALRRTRTMEDVLDQMRTEIDVQVIKGDSFRVSYISRDPALAMRVAERLASLFIDENLRDREVLAEGTNEFLQAQLEDSRKRLIAYEKRVSDYEREHSDELPSQLNFNLQAQHNAEMQVQALLDSISSERDRRLLIQRQLTDATAKPTAGSAPIARADGGEAELSAAAQLESAQNALTALETRLKPEHPDVIRLKRAIAELEKKVAAEASAPRAAVPVAAPPPANASQVAELRNELASLTQQIAAKEEQETRLRATIATYQKRIQAAPVRASELAELTRDYDTLQQMYRSLLQKSEDSKISSSLEKRQVGEQFRVLDPPHLPEKPFSPNRAKINAIGALMGLFLGVGLAALIEYTDTSMRSESDVVAALALPVLALVPFVEGKHDRQRRRRKRLVWAITCGMTLILALAGIAWKLRA